MAGPKSRLLIGSLLAGLLSVPSVVFAHCDTLDGPVVMAAKKALDEGNVNYALIWVKKDDEGTIREAFNHTTTVRKLNADAKELADMYFFETLVRIHRAGEGAPYAGLKPAGQELAPGLAAADKAVETGKLEPVKTLLTNSVQQGLQERFETLTARKKFQPNNVDAGRDYVESYVKFIHYVDGVYQMSKNGPTGHAEEGEAPAGEAAHGH